MKAKKKILVTSALPYANGPIHLGHLVEYIQTDIWVRFNKSIGNTVVYICADDAHGTPIMLKAKEQGISPEELISITKKEHEKDFKKFFINFDKYSSTNSEKNKEFCENIFNKLNKSGHISQKTISQFYDEKEKMFLPDRYIKGTCPKCNAEDQYGDSCESCGATYSPTELINPTSVLSGTKPKTKDTNHFFFNLKNFKNYLIKWTKENNLQPAIKNKLDEWLNDNLNDWDITRDAPYFGFLIPNEKAKYFYVWMDAPIGYIAAFEEYSKENSELIGIWENENIGEIYHFIGKDIAYFHALFWPSILNGSGYRTPTGIFCHGFLTVDGKKMSKSRGTFIKASDYLKHLDPEYLRYYFASKLNDGIEDIDLNFEDFTKKINSDLVGKLINLASRCSSFLEKNSNFTLSEKLENDEKFKDFINQANEVEKYYSNRKFSNAISKIMQMTDNANQYINQEKPWSLKDIKKIQQISTQGLNYFRSLAILLSPIMPDLFEKTEIMFNEKNLKWENCFSPLLNKKIKKFTVLKTRIKDESIEQLKSNLINNSESSSKEESKMQNEIEYDIFSKTEIRIGEIITAEEIDGADKLLKLSVDIGDLGEREIFAGIKKFYEAKNLIGSKVLVVVNLKPKKMKFGTSSGMVLAADSEGEIIVIEANNKIKNGSRVK
jgi:methionyl-tRNA synthetase|tara:strand:- start:4494 stop:6485 length:1992 start_codon:yes stop_codon:yes gene_type:complete